MVQWHKIGERSGTVFFFNLISLGIFDDNCRREFGFKLGINAFRNYCHEIGYKEEEFNLGLDIITAELSRRGPAYFTILANKLDKKGKKLAELCFNINKRPPRDIEGIKNSLEKVRKLAVPYSSSLVLANIIEPVIEKKIREMISRNVADRALRESYFQILTSSELIDETELESEEIRKIRLKIEKQKSNINSVPIQKMIKSHVKRWSWLFEGRVGKGKSSVKTAIESRLTKPASELSIYGKKVKIIKESNQIISLIKISKDYVKLVKNFVYFRTHRMNLFIKSSYYLSDLIRNISDILNIEPALINQMTFDEITNALDGQTIPISELTSRLDTRSISMLSQNGLVTAAIVTRQGERRDYASYKTLKGTIACKGIQKGKAKLVLSILDLPKVNRGDILVSSMTVPEFVPAMEKASAFVTNEGGITCHAAIIAREMKKPCIIGTKIATQVINDGDLVEVDANKGIIKVIKKAKP